MKNRKGLKNISDILTKFIIFKKVINIVIIYIIIFFKSLQLERNRK